MLFVASLQSQSIYLRVFCCILVAMNFRIHWFFRDLRVDSVANLITEILRSYRLGSHVKADWLCYWIYIYFFIFNRNGPTAPRDTPASCFRPSGCPHALHHWPATSGRAAASARQIGRPVLKVIRNEGWKHPKVSVVMGHTLILYYQLGNLYGNKLFLL